MLVVALAGCGGPDAATAERTCRALSERVCAGLVACGCAFDVRPYDAAGCVAARTAECTDRLDRAVGADLAGGRLRLDDAAISRCLDDVDALAGACALALDRGPLPASCDGIVVATAALGAACGISGLAPCAGGGGLCGPDGRCVALPGDGSPCPLDACADGLVCSRAGDEPRCALAAAAGGPCGADGDCARGLVCPPAGRCAPPGDVDAACTDARDCADGLACDDDGRCALAAPLGAGCDGPATCGAGRSCGRAPDGRVCGDAGALGDPCEDGTCGAGLGCGFASRTCEALPGEGAPCLDGVGCADGTTCAFDTTTCVPLPGEGAPCLAIAARVCGPGLGCAGDQTCQPASTATVGQPCLSNGTDEVCAEGLGCDFGAQGSICVVPGGEGAACNTDRTCADGTYCELSTLRCTVRRADGAPCADGNECRVGSECAPGPGGFACAPIPGPGAACTSACVAPSVCAGPGGVCVPALCVIP